MTHVLNRVVLSQTQLPHMKQLSGEIAKSILEQQGYTHVHVDDDGNIDAISPMGEPIRRYKLFTRKSHEVPK